MTNFQQLFHVLWQPKWRLMNLLLGFWAAAVVITVIATGWSQGFTQLDYGSLISGWLSVSLFVALLGLAHDNERVVRDDSLRLIPVSEIKLYLTNLLAAFGAYLYFAVVGAVVLFGTLLVTVPHFWYELLHSSTGEPGGLGDLLTMGSALALLMVLLLLGTWVVITLVHLAGNVISNLLPGGRQRVVKIGLAIVLFMGLIYLSRWLLSLQAVLTTGLSGTGTLWFSLALLALVIALMAATNIYLLKRWVEARY